MNEEAKKQTLLMIPYGLYVIGVKGADGTLSAFTANWLSQASFKPPLVMLATKIDSRSFPLLEASGRFSVSFLEEGQKSVAASFFKPPEYADGKMAGHRVELTGTGCPVLCDAPAWAEVEVRHIHAGGDHAVVVGEVVDAVMRRSARILMLGDTGWKYGG